MRKQFLLLLLISQLTIATKTFAQNIAINSAGSLPDTSAMLDVSSTVKGLLAPRMTTAQQNAIPLPATGLLLYNTTTNTFNVNVGTAASPSWSPLSFAGASSTTHTISSSVNTITSAVNGVSAAAPAVNSNSLSLSGSNLTSAVNGVASAALDLSSLAGASVWKLTGNGGTTAGTSFVGTTDGQALVFKVNGTQAGYLGLSGSSYATALGVSTAAAFKSTAIGASASANSGNEATALGYNASAAGFRSIAIGSGSQTSSSQNEAIALGYGSQSTSYQGIAIGSGASAASGNNTMSIGVSASATGYQAAAIGNGASASAQNSTAIGNGATVSTANYIAIGNTSVTAIRGQVNFTTYSDGRFKRNIKSDVPGLNFILQLRPVTYNWDIHKFNAHSRGTDFKSMNVKYADGADEAAILKKESIQYTGFIAQEVELAAQKCKFNFSGVLKPADDKDAYSLSYAEFVVPLVKSTQELNNKIEAQQKLIDQLMKEVTELKKKIK